MPKKPPRVHLRSWAWSPLEASCSQAHWQGGMWTPQSYRCSPFLPSPRLVAVICCLKSFRWKETLVLYHGLQTPAHLSLMVWSHLGAPRSPIPDGVVFSGVLAVPHIFVCRAFHLREGSFCARHLDRLFSVFGVHLQCCLIGEFSHGPSLRSACYFYSVHHCLKSVIYFLMVDVSFTNGAVGSSRAKFFSVT